ncbi:MAG: hypothetical protein HRF51_00955 [bacterium]
MKLRKFLLTALATAITIATAWGTEEQIYGQVVTSDGETLEGFIRWDRNEGFWDDILDGYRKRDDSRRDDYSSRRSGTRKVSIFGITVYREEGDEMGWDWGDKAQSGIRFGHIKTIKPIDGQRARIELKSGEKFEIENSSTDLGESMRELLIDDRKQGILELLWEEIEKIDFMPAPSISSNFGRRLYGEAFTRRGDSFRGFVCWDVDEIYDTDILDGEDGRRKRKIEFGKISKIEPLSSQSALVVLKDGTEMELENSNDIDSGNRGVIISDPKLGRISIDWDELEKVEFAEPVKGVGYDDFDGGRRLEGKVILESGDELSGEIRWDDDEEFTWEILDGEFQDIELDIEFGLIKSIEKISSRTSKVTLKDGRAFKLRNSNDIDSDNRGIFVLEKGHEEMIEWDEFRRVEFR